MLYFYGYKIIFCYKRTAAADEFLIHPLFGTGFVASFGLRFSIFDLRVSRWNETFASFSPCLAACPMVGKLRKRGGGPWFLWLRLSARKEIIVSPFLRLLILRQGQPSLQMCHQGNAFGHSLSRTTSSISFLSYFRSSHLHVLILLLGNFAMYIKTKSSTAVQLWLLFGSFELMMTASFSSCCALCKFSEVTFESLQFFKICVTKAILKKKYLKLKVSWILDKYYRTIYTLFVVIFWYNMVQIRLSNWEVLNNELGVII